MNYQISKIISLFIFILVLTLSPLENFAKDENLEESCLLLAEKGCQDLNPTKCREELEECEKYYGEESARIEEDLSKTEQEKKTLQNKIYTLNKKIQNFNYQIYQSNLIINDLSIQVGDTEESIGKISLKIEDSKDKLGNILRNIYEEDQKTVIEVLLSEAEISDFFNNLAALETLNSRSKDLLQNIKILKSNLEQQKQLLDDEKGDLEHMVKIQTLQKEESAKTKGEQEYYLGLTETEYQRQLKEKQETEKKAAEIRARIFELIGVSKAPTFGEAYEIAKYVASVTGIRPAFLLAILQQESAVGRNVGQCYLKEQITGSGIRINTEQKVAKVMNPNRDVPPFLTITKNLGRDPFSTPVSCPMSVGWGGAMGPAQFIPSTWISYKDRLAGILDKAADPWNIKDSFLAAGLYLSDYGAKLKNKDGEWKAAMIYFSGSTTNSAFYWYADNVRKIADGFEIDIEIIEKNR